MIYGERGIGKSILTRVASENFAAKHPDRVIRVEVNGRSIQFRQFLKALAAGLVAKTKPLLSSLDSKEHTLSRWLEELALLAHNDQISQGQVNTITTKYGIGAQIGGSLFDVLTGSNSFSWEQSRLGTGTTSRVQQVNDDLLHDALKATLKRIHDETPFMVVVFFDDLDQAYADDDPLAMKTALKRVLDIDPCVGLVHMRTEMLFDDLRREMDRLVEVGSLDEHGLMAMIEKRLDAATLETRNAVRHAEIQGVLRRLMHVTGNPLVFLRWAQAFFQTGRWSPSTVEGWDTDEALLDVTSRTASGAGIEKELLSRLALIVDRCAPKGRREVQKKDLLAGRLTTDTCADGKKLTEEEFKHFLRTGGLIPVDRFREDTAYRLDPMLDLLRPSVAQRLREH